MDTKITDCVLYNGEWKMLLLRMMELNSIVDKFVVVEAKYSFSGKSKDFQFEHHKSLFASFEEKIVYLKICEDDPTWSPWQREEFQRNFAHQYLVNHSKIVLLSDVDEIPYLNSIEEILNRPVNEVVGLRLSLYYFAFDFKLIDGPDTESVWNCIFDVKELDTKTLEEIRMGARKLELGYPTEKVVGAHLSYFMNQAELKRKLESFSHQELNTWRNRNKLKVKNVVRLQQDLFGRKDYIWGKINEIPEFSCLRNNFEMFNEFTTKNILENH